jgi:hypothetical protein
MGHCNMLLAVAGLDRQAVNDHTRKLASGDWSDFPAAERAALAFARRTAGNAGLSSREFGELVAQCGRERALDILWWVGHCHYMTRVADAFQLPLERGNVFDGFTAASRPRGAF